MEGTQRDSEPRRMKPTAAHSPVIQCLPMRSPASLVLVAGALLIVTLGAQAPPTPTPPAGRGGRGGAGQGVPPPSRGGGGGGGSAGPADKPLVDFTAAERGKEVWIAECISCHGAQ